MNSEYRKVYSSLSDKVLAGEKKVGFDRPVLKLYRSINLLLHNRLYLSEQFIVGRDSLNKLIVVAENLVQLCIHL